MSPKQKSARQRQKESNRPSRHERLGLPKPPSAAQRKQQEQQQQQQRQRPEQAPRTSSKRPRDSGVLDRRVDSALSVALQKHKEDDWMDEEVTPPSTPTHIPSPHTPPQLPGTSSGASLETTLQESTPAEPMITPATSQTTGTFIPRARRAWVPGLQWIGSCPQRAMYWQTEARTGRPLSGSSASSNDGMSDPEVTTSAPHGILISPFDTPELPGERDTFSPDGTTI